MGGEGETVEVTRAEGGIPAPPPIPSPVPLPVTTSHPSLLALQILFSHTNKRVDFSIPEQFPLDQLAISVYC